MPQVDALVKKSLGSLSAYKAFAKSFPAKLDANESPWPLPEAARRRLADALAQVDLHRYPDAGAHALREALAARLGVADPDTLVLGVGSDESLAMLMRALSEPRPGRTQSAILYPDPSFVMYGMRALVEDAEPVPVPLTRDFQLDVSGMREAIARTRPNVIFLATPNNPTGNAFRDADVLAVVEAAPDALVVIDEAYGAFAGRSLRSLLAGRDHVAFMGTLSKIGLAAARVGWVELPRALADQVEKVRQPYNLNTLSQVVATLALTELWPTLEEHVRAICDERTRLGTELARIDGLFVNPSDANFFLVRVAHDSEGLARELLARGISVRAFKGGSAALAGHLRITVGTPGENDLLLAALRELVRAR